MHWTDIPSAADIERESFPSDAWSIETFWSELSGVPENRRYLVACEANRLVAYAGLAISRPDSDIQTIAVDSSHRGLGVGRFLVRELMQHAITEGCESIHLEVRSDNQVALDLYASLGFEQISQRNGYYDDSVDALIMRASLTGDIPAPRAQRRVEPEASG